MTLTREARLEVLDRQESLVRETLARRDFGHFLFYVQVQQPSLLAGEPGGAVPYALWPHLMTLKDALGSYRRVILLKPKQIGASWTMAAYALWTAMYHQSARVLLFSMGERESIELLAKARFIYERLPVGLRVALKGQGNSQEMQFPSVSSQVLALPATKTVGVGFTASLVVMDEADFFEDFSEAYDIAAMPTIAAGGQIVVVSTPNPVLMVSPFRSLVTGAVDYVTFDKTRPGAAEADSERVMSGNGFVRLYFPWNVRPGRDQAWYDREEAASLDRARFQKNYSRSLGEALAPAQALAAFDLEALEAMRLLCRPPLQALGHARVWQKFTVGHTYCAGSDVGSGSGQDYSVTVVRDRATGMVVADLFSNLLAPDVFTYESIQLLHEFKDPLWAPEDNDLGHVVIDRARSMFYPRLWNRDETGKAEKYGWHTDANTRPLLWSALQSDVRSGLVVVPCEDGLTQFFSVILNPKKGGRPEAMEGMHDDYPMAVGIAGMMREHAHRAYMPARRGRDAPAWRGV